MSAGSGNGQGRGAGLLRQAACCDSLGTYPWHQNLDGCFPVTPGRVAFGPIFFFAGVVFAEGFGGNSLPPPLVAYGGPLLGVAGAWCGGHLCAAAIFLRLLLLEASSWAGCLVGGHIGGHFFALLFPGSQLGCCLHPAAILGRWLYTAAIFWVGSGTRQPFL